MPSQLAIDLTRSRVRALEIDGNAKSPRVKSFVAGDVAPLPPPTEEGETPKPLSWSEALRELASRGKFTREPSAVALASIDCIFRDLELPFTTPDQIDKVIKFEAESHLQLVEIDSVVVSYQMLDSDGRGGSRLLTAACQKELVRGVLRDLNSIGVDPQFADLHLTAIYTALRATGYLDAVPVAPADAPPSEVDRGEAVLVLECDRDLTHLLVARGDTLLAGRAIRLGFSAAKPDERTEPVEAQAEGAEGAAATDQRPRHHEHDETLVVVDDLAGEDGGRPGRRAGDYFARLKREVQRTLFRLGTAGESIQRALVLGPAARDEAFVKRLESALELAVEVARPFDQVEHSLDAETLEEANAEGVAALGVALRLLGAHDGSRIDFRREEVRYARRFDQVKVALSCLAIVALVCVALLCIEQAKQYRVKQTELMAATSAVLGEYQQHADSRELAQQVNSGKEEPLGAVKKAKQELIKRKEELGVELGRSGTIPRLASGLDYLNAIAIAIDKNIESIGRIEVSMMSLDLRADDGKQPRLEMSLLLKDPPAVDAFVAALRASPAVKAAQQPTTTPAKDGRLQISGMEIDLVPDYDPRRRADSVSQAAPGAAEKRSGGP